MECMRSLKVLDSPVEYWDHMLVVLVVDKLDPDTRAEWTKSLTGTSPATYDELMEFIERHTRSLIARDASSRPSGQQPRPPQPEQRQIRTHHIATAFSSTHCIVCNSPAHPLFRCPRFLEMHPSQRRSAARKTKSCLNCLYASHQSNECPSIHSCKRCGEKHHTLLHEDFSTRNRQQAAPQQPRTSSAPTHQRQTTEFSDAASSSRVSVVQSNSSSTAAPTLLKTALVYARTSSGERVPCRVFLDDGSEASFITEACASALGLPRSPVNVVVSGVGQAITTHVKQATSLRLESAHSQAHISVSACILKKVSGLMPPQQIPFSTIDQWQHMKNLPLADPHFYRPAKIDILLGADATALAVTSGIHQGQAHQPIATNTIFGYVLHGRIQSQQSIATHHVRIHSTSISSMSHEQQFRLSPHQSSGMEKPASLPSRNQTSVEELIASEPEWNGSAWLTTSHEQQQLISPPFAPSPAEEDALNHERRVIVNCNSNSPPLIVSFTERFSSLHRLITAAIFMRRLIHIMKERGRGATTVEDFMTISCNIEACLNSRPLSCMSTDPKDMEVFTPGHFLVGGPLTAVPEPALTHIHVNRLDHWQRAQQLVQHFWSR